MLRCKHFYQDINTGEYKSYMKNVSPHYFKCEKCGSVIHRVDNDRLNDIIWLRNRGGKGYKHTRLESDIINAVPPVDGEYKVY